MLRQILISIIAMLLPLCVAAHSFPEHRADMYDMLPIHECEDVDQWMRHISFELLDNASGVERPEYGGLQFYDYLKQHNPGFACKHRVLFHWGYNVRPWSDYLQEKVEGYGWTEEQIKRLQQDLINEQRMRNRTANAMTEELFGFASGGTEARYANAMISIIYDTHILGDYVPGNNDLDGLQSLSSVIGDVINAIRKLDEAEGADFIKGLRSISSKQYADDQVKAEAVLNYMKQEMKGFLCRAQGGMLIERWRKKGVPVSIFS